jgi:transposase-like protein
MIPADESVPLKGSTFLDWEQQTQQLKQALIPTVLEERAALEDNAWVHHGGHCPYCSSDRIYLQKDSTTQELHSPDGPVLIPRQHCRCRSCGRSFSPSES